MLLQAAIFYVGYSLKRLQLDRDFRLGVPTLFLEFLQWLILIFGPEWDWDINWSNRYAHQCVAAFLPPNRALKRCACCSWWRFYSRWQLQRAIAERNHTVFLAVFYLMVALVFFILAVCVYIHWLTRSRKKPKWQW